MSCRNSARQSISWTELVDSDMDQDEVTIAVLKAAKELIEDQEREIAALKARINEG